MTKNWKLEFFPKEKKLSYDNTFWSWLILGSFGVHQFYLGNKKKGFYLLSTSGLSHFLILLALCIKINWPKGIFLYVYLGIIILGAILGVPVLIWDLIKMRDQVKAVNRDRLISQTTVELRQR